MRLNIYFGIKNGKSWKKKKPKKTTETPKRIMVILDDCNKTIFSNIKHFWLIPATLSVSVAEVERLFFL